jgi:protoporphyrinogen oxidase
VSDEPIVILGGGISALAFAHFWDGPALILEKESRAGGLCRSFDIGGVACDVGPHIMFSKDAEVLAFMKSLAPTNQLRRSNRIFHRGRFVKYPFENDLGALPPRDRDWCLSSFLSNPYRGYPAADMLRFFYRTFGEGITRLYLEPYNRKIWKYEPSFMDTQMVERIPCPPPEDVIASAEGRSTEGYLHQLYFDYPAQGGTESLIHGLLARVRGRADVRTGASVQRVTRLQDGSFEVCTGDGTVRATRLVSSIPIHTLVNALEPAPPAEIVESARRLLYNSIHVTIVHADADAMGDNFAVMVPDAEISFHRVSKLNFLGAAYHAPGRTTLMAEVTYRRGDRFDVPAEETSRRVVADLERLGFIPAGACRHAETMSFEHAYVIYDLDHRSNTDRVLGWLAAQGITSIGRFATFEYINMDAAIARARDAALRLRQRTAIPA